MTDPHIQALAAQVQANTAQIEAESGARVVADELLGKRIDSLEAAMGGQIQSANYVPGVSGWKLNALTGDFEIHSCTLGSAANAPERQMVSVEVASWSKYDLPKNAANLLQFMRAELEKVPEEYRHAAEFEEFDASYSDESFNARLFLSYSRLETEEELADRLEKAKVAGTRIGIKDGLMTVTHDGVVRIKLGNLDQTEQPQPFKVDGDQVFISQAAIQDSIVKSPWPAAWGARMQLGENGKYYAAGIGLPSQILVSADLFAMKPSATEAELIDALSGAIGITQLCKSLKAEVDKMKLDRLAEQGQVDAERLLNAEKVKDVIRAELRQGGLLWRRS
ncbi:DUF1983 domain-containing protein [Pseudomonas canadensis]|uniref:DUF1983 domain-containing protein n=1 Tax=Pseudomonas canadensis TaxID=915099 RepID=UPI000428EFA1|nr:DUF1983 domain-containing protein [Pseudomonas canadensis]